MPTQIQLLATLQLVDQSLRAKTLEIGEAESRVAAIEEALRAQTLVTSAARSEHEALTARQRDLEARLAVAETKAKDRRMRITRIRNDKELGLMRRELELLKDETTSLETELVGVMELVEGSSAKLEGLEAELTRLTTERDGEADELREKQARLAGEMDRERAERTELISTVDGDLRRKYEMIFSRRGGVAVVEIREGICLGCRMRVPPQLFNEIQRNEQVILCPSCQRMLYWRTEAEEANG